MDAMADEDMLCDILGDDKLCETVDKLELEGETVELRLDEGVVGATEAVDDEELCWIEEELAPTLLAVLEDLLVLEDELKHLPNPAWQPVPQ
jgi:hypothetical protein